MSVRGHTKDWSQRDEYNDSNYDPQYADDDNRDTVQLDHSRLYITNIPTGLNEVGLHTAFAKYGTLHYVFLSPDPHRRYGMIQFESPGEAKLAMMKLNRTEPLKLNIAIAHCRKRNQDQNNRNRHGDNRDRSKRDDKTSGQRERDRDSNNSSSWGRHSNLMANGDNITADDMQADFEEDELDPELELQLEELQLQQLALQEAQLQCKQRMLLRQAEHKVILQASASNRCVLPGGKVVVRNVVDGPTDPDSSSTAGGDSRVASRSCISCGARSEAFCGRCGVTPYCSDRCQRRDWIKRHRTVCHNLAGSAEPQDVKGAGDTVAPAPRGLPSTQRDVPKPAQLAAVGNQAKPYYQKNRNDQRSQSGHDRIEDEVKKVPPSAPSGVRNVDGNRRDYGNDNQDRRRPPLRHEQANKDNNSGPKRWYNRKGNGGSQPATKRGQDHTEYNQYTGTAVKPEPVIEAVKPLRQPAKAEAPAPAVPAAKPPTPAVPTVKPPTPAVTAAKPLTPAVPAAKPPGSIADVTPTRKLVPKNCIIETLSIGDVVVLSVDTKASECRAQTGFVCLSMHESHEAEYQSLCEAYGAACEADTADYTPSPGESFSCFSPSDGGWYRARCVSAALAALLDGCKLVPLSGARCRRLAAPYDAVPEFCCVLQADVQIGAQLQCTLLAKTANGYKVSLLDAESGATGEGEVSRWMPAVECAPHRATTLSVAPRRPALSSPSSVLLVASSDLKRACVRPADTEARKQHDAILQDVVLYGRSAVPLMSPPVPGQTVVALCGDAHGRAVVTRTSVARNKYLVEFIELGTVETLPLESLFPCPTQLDLAARPTLTTQVELHVQGDNPLTPAASAYLDKLKETVELTLTLPDGAKSAPSGSAVTLTVAKNNEVVNRKVQEMCTPEWKKIEERGGDVVDTASVMFDELQYLSLPAGGCELELLDLSTLEGGNVAGCERGLPHAQHVLTHLTDKITKYCESAVGREPYLPKENELCIAQCPPYPQWFRAVVMECGGPGAPTASLYYVDYGNVEKAVPVALLRKMMPEFVRDLPALAVTLDIRDFPQNPTAEQLCKAVEVLGINEEGHGFLRVTRCEKIEEGAYIVDAPELIAAMMSV